MSMLNWTDLLNLPLMCLKVEAQAHSKIVLPPFAGSKLEGALGEALFGLSCVRREHHAEHGCRGCSLHAICAYGQLYEPIPTQGFQAASAKTAPRPLAFATTYGQEQVLQQDKPFSFGLTIIGSALSQLPFLLNALHACGENGLGKTRGRFSIMRITSTNPYTGEDLTLYSADAPRLLTNGLVLEPQHFPPLPPRVIRLRFLSMVQVKHQKKLLYRPHFESLVRNLQRRLSNLEQLYGAAATVGQNYGLLPTLAKEVTVRYEEEDYVAQRRSKSTLLSGFLGTIHLEGDLLPFTRLLRYGELVGVGRWASFGMGRYQVEPG